MGILENIYRANDKSTEMKKLVEFYKGHDSIQNSLERVVSKLLTPWYIIYSESESDMIPICPRLITI